MLNQLEQSSERVEAFRRNAARTGRLPLKPQRAGSPGKAAPDSVLPEGQGLTRRLNDLEQAVDTGTVSGAELATKIRVMRQHQGCQASDVRSRHRRAVPSCESIWRH